MKSSVERRKVNPADGIVRGDNPLGPAAQWMLNHLARP